MAITVKQLLRRRGALVAAVTAVCLGALALAQRIVAELVAWMGVSQAASTSNGLYELQRASRWGELFAGSLTTLLPFAVGFFLSLWLVAPVADQLGLGHVITRSVLATGIGATVWFVVLALVRILESVMLDGPIFAQSFPDVSYTGPDIPGMLGSALQDALLGFVFLLPAGVLAGILLWHWLRAHPREFHVSGLLDV